MPPRPQTFLPGGVIQGDLIFHVILCGSHDGRAREHLESSLGQGRHPGMGHGALWMGAVGQGLLYMW